MYVSSKSISRVLYSIIIYLGPLLPGGSSDLPLGRDEPSLFKARSWSCSGWGLQSRKVASALVSSYLAFPSLPFRAVYFCCTILGVASTGYYPAPLLYGARTFLVFTRLSDLLEVHYNLFEHEAQPLSITKAW